MKGDQAGTNSRTVSETLDYESLHVNKTNFQPPEICNKIRN